MHEVSDGSLEGEGMGDWCDGVVEWPCTFCGVSWLDECFGMVSDKLVGVDDSLLDGSRHSVCVWVILEKVLASEFSVEVAANAICSKGVFGEVYKVDGFAWWEVHLLLLSLLGGYDSFCRSMGRGELWCLVWGVVDCGVGICSGWWMGCRVEVSAYLGLDAKGRVEVYLR